LRVFSKQVLSVVSCTLIFGYFSAAIGRTYFPADSEFASLMFSLATFAVGFMMRPVGAILLGVYIDHIGRRKGLLVTLVYAEPLRGGDPAVL
jgi:MFS family permease